MSRITLVGAALLQLALAAVSHAQVNQPVRLVGGYRAGVKPQVIVLAMPFPNGDSIRAIIQNDFHISNTITVIQRTDSLKLPASETEYAVMQQMGAAALVHATPAPGGGILVALYDVAGRDTAATRRFVLPDRPNSYEWRQAVHGVSDQLQEMITGRPGLNRTVLAFVRGGSVFIIDFDGQHERLFHGCELCLSPAFHPTQPFLAFSFRNARGGWNIVTKPLAGGTVRSLTTGATTDMSPAFSPSGADVYFARQDETGTIFAMPFAGGAIRRVTNSRRGLSSVTVSPDGSRLAYVHDALGPAFVFVTSVDGSSTQPLVTYVGGTKTYYEAPSWSPDGNRIAVQTRSGEDAAYQIAILDVATRNPRLMTSSASNEDPSWAPDSRHLVFTSTRVGGKQLWILDTESGNLRQLTRGAPVKTPAWSPPPR